MISVIVPVHNVEKFLPRCINSILRSTYSNLEILLIENGSTDNSLKICNSYAEKYDNVRVYIADKTGCPHARNIGLDHANGEYITFIDSDDYISPLMYEKLISVAIKNNPDFVFCDYAEGIDTDYDFKDTTHESFKIINADEFLYNIYVKERTGNIVVWNKLIKRDVIGDLRFDETLIGPDDRVFSVQLAHKCDTIVYSNQKLYYYYRGDSNSICNSANLDRRTEMFCKETDYNYFKSADNVPPSILDYIAVSMLRGADFRLKNARGGYDGKHYPEQIKKLKPLVKKYLKLVWSAKHISKTDKILSLFHHYCPRLFDLAYKIKHKIFK